MKAIWKRLAFAWLLTALVCGLFAGAALAIGNASIDGASPVTGTTGSNIDAKTFTLTISGNSLNAIPSSAEFASWITDMPDGLSVIVASGSPSTKSSVRITIEGTPTQYGSAPFSIVIPKEALHDAPPEGMTVTAGGNARWDIAAPASSVIAVSLSGGACYTPYDDFATGWNAAVGGGNTANAKVRLLQSWSAGAGGFGTGDGFLEHGILVPAGKTVELDLCGKTVSASSSVLGYAVTVNGNLTLSDSEIGGKLTGARHGCVNIGSAGSFAMIGGSITGNNADAADGNVYVGGSFSVSGSASVAGNMKGADPCNVYLPNGKAVEVVGTLSAGARIGVTTQTPPTRYAPVAITNTATTDTSASFTSDDARYAVQNALNNVVKLIVRQRVDVAITPTNRFPIGNAGADLTVNVGHGIPDSDLGAANISDVQLDGSPLREGTDYTKADGGSVLITLYKHYLNTIPAGAHTLVVAIGSGLYAGVTVATGLTVTPRTPPKTGDDAQLWLWLGLAAGAALIARLVLWRKRRHR